VSNVVNAATGEMLHRCDSHRPPAQQCDLVGAIATAMEEQQATVNGINGNVAPFHPHRSVNRHRGRGITDTMIDLSELAERSRIDVEGQGGRPVIVPREAAMWRNRHRRHFNPCNCPLGPRDFATREETPPVARSDAGASPRDARRQPGRCDAIYFILLRSALPDTLKSAQGNAPNLRYIVAVFAQCNR